MCKSKKYHNQQKYMNIRIISNKEHIANFVMRLLFQIQIYKRALRRIKWKHNQLLELSYRLKKKTINTLSKKK